MRLDSSIWTKTLRVVLALAFLAAGTLHFHAEDPSTTGHRAAGAPELLRSAASHPQAPLHMERVDVERAPRCPVCLLRDKSAAVGPGFSALAVVDRASTAFVAAPAAAPIQRNGAPGRPRGPPLL